MPDQTPAFPTAPDSPLPPVLTSPDAAAWPTRRAELFETFQRELYGRPPVAPPAPDELAVDVFEHGDYLDGRADRFQIRVPLTADPDGPAADMLLYVPADTLDPVPCFLGLNFAGNYATQHDPEIRMTDAWVHERFGADAQGRASEDARGCQARRWPLEQIIDAGYALATIYIGDIDPDFDDGFRNGLHGAITPDPSERQGDSWGTISAWAWGLSRGLDALQTFNMVVDPESVVVIGHSRLGKTSLWAAASDERFAGCISNNSGCGGSSLYRGSQGEKLTDMTKTFPYWLCENAFKYVGHTEDLPIDAHALMALVAPRPLYIASASEDAWADPANELLALHHAAPVWRLLGVDVPDVPATLPAPGGDYPGHIAYHLRQGEHDILAWDWQRFLAWADRHLD